MVLSLPGLNVVEGFSGAETVFFQQFHRQRFFAPFGNLYQRIQFNRVSRIGLHQVVASVGDITLTSRKIQALAINRKYCHLASLSKAHC